jgi:Flp pilus assembly protein protease CpaA
VSLTSGSRFFESQAAMNTLLSHQKKLGFNELYLLGVVVPIAIPIAAVYGLEVVLALILFVTLCFAAYFDCRTHQIPNLINYTAFLTAGITLIIAQPTSHSPNGLFASSLIQGVSGATICFLLSVLVWNFGGFGGGDVKLSTVIGLILGSENGLTVFMLAQILAASFLLWFRLADFAAKSSKSETQRSGLPMAGFYSYACILLALSWCMQ